MNSAPKLENLGKEKSDIVFKCGVGWLAFRLIADESAERGGFVRRTRSLSREIYHPLVFQIQRAGFLSSPLHADVWILDPEN